MRTSRRNALMTLAAGAAAQPLTAAAPMDRIRLVALDVGGTIIEDRGDVVGTLRSSMAKRGITVSAAEIGPWRGAAKRAVIEHFARERSGRNEAGVKKLAAEILEDFNASLNQTYRSVPPIAGAEEAIRALREKNYLVAATTGFDRAIVIPIFRRLDWEKYFAAIVASDDVAEGRPAPYMLFHAMEAARVNNVAEVLAVGDTPLDLQAAANAGVGGMVGVLSGAGTAEQLEREPHTGILPSVASLPGLLGAAPVRR
jgi:phosphonatase-like hydrolase